MSTGRHRAPSPPLDLTLVETGTTALTLTAHGHLDTATVDDLHDALEVLLTQPGLAHLLLDLGRLASIDSAGVAALAAAHQGAERHGITLTVVNCGGTVRQALENSGLYGHLTRARVDGHRERTTAATPRSHLPEPRRSESSSHAGEHHAPGLTAAASGPNALAAARRPARRRPRRDFSPGKEGVGHLDAPRAGRERWTGDS